MGMRYDTFEEVMQGLAKKRRTAHLLLGNGFSMAYDPNIFSYNALYDFVSSLKDSTLEAIFGAMKTKNFELMMEQLDASLSLLKALGVGTDVQEKPESAIEKLKNSLLAAIKALHPEHVFKIPEAKSAACAKFIEAFTGQGGKVFTTNYDLLLYWILMRQNVPNSVDGFGRELLNPVEVEYDDHIIDALNKANHYRTKSAPKLRSVYIGTYSDKDMEWIASIEKKFHAKVHTFDAKTANIWGP
jgi:hypothetical protein